MDPIGHESTDAKFGRPPSRGFGATPGTFSGFSFEWEMVAPSGVLLKIEVIIRPSSHKIKGEHTSLLPLSGGGYTPL
jgi:hypothetical protein